MRMIVNSFMEISKKLFKNNYKYNYKHIDEYNYNGIIKA